MPLTCGVLIFGWGEVFKDEFCYNCITRWANVAASQCHESQKSIQCPLCKTENFSIIHGYGDISFQRHYIGMDHKKSFTLSEAHRFRLQCYSREPGALCKEIDVMKYWKSKGFLRKTRWLQSWVQREIQALIHEEDVDIIVHHILGVIESFLRRMEQEHQCGTPEQKRDEFKTLAFGAATPFLNEITDRFVDELEIFLAAGLTIEAYDELYLQSWIGNQPSEMVERSNQTTGHWVDLHLFDDDSDII
ncbi:uncharacterized protein LOC18440544 isoform X2 [Amborella trichopoda]|uniref:uncharacterized protein LOC18440544 isoform X2 n=1 Tax=Amborella trichopoda TaxID=13333 RepID=UPI0005D3CDF2|nr:uncharacterized protein LOC18440544 isoform X2 [Amborella trichopoda]|eukprot:XP_011625681.1 uncharacterized protein LOC18440544 isoform X2 [Amborella trichopoda]